MCEMQYYLISPLHDLKQKLGIFLILRPENALVLLVHLSTDRYQFHHVKFWVQHPACDVLIIHVSGKGHRNIKKSVLLVHLSTDRYQFHPVNFWVQHQACDVLIYTVYSVSKKGAKNISCIMKNLKIMYANFLGGFIKGIGGPVSLRCLLF